MGIKALELDWSGFSGITRNKAWAPDLQALVYTALNFMDGEGDADDDAAEQIIERLLDAICTGIKALEWDDIAGKRHVATTVVGIYTIVRYHSRFALVRPQDSFDGFGYAFEGPLAYCKAAAQADYEARIRSALHPTPTPAGIGRIQSSLHPSFSRSGIEPCGGCGQSDPSKRCLGCLHSFPFTPTPVSAPVGESVEVHIVFQDDGGAANLRFVEVETLDRKSVCAGTWLKRDDGYDVLALSVHPSDIKTVEAK